MRKAPLPPSTSPDLKYLYAKESRKAPLAVKEGAGSQSPERRGVARRAWAQIKAHEGRLAFGAECPGIFSVSEAAFVKIGGLGSRLSGRYRQRPARRCE